MRHILFAITLLFAAVSWAISQDNNEPLQRAQRLCAQIDSLLVEKNVSNEVEKNIADGFNSISKDLFQSNEFSQIKYLAGKRKAMIEKYLGKDNAQYANCLSWLALSEMGLDNYSEGVQLQKQALELADKHIDHDSLEYVYYIDDYASYCNAFGDYEQAVNMGQKALDLMKRFPTKEQYINVLFNRLAQYKANLNGATMSSTLSSDTSSISNMTPEWAEEFVIQQIESKNWAALLPYIKALVEKQSTDDPEQFSNVLRIYAMALIECGYFDDGITNYRQVMALNSELYGRVSVQYVQMLEDYASFCENHCLYSESIWAVLEQMDITGLVNEKDMRYYAQILRLSNLFRKNDEYTIALQLAEESRNYYQQLLNQFSGTEIGKNLESIYMTIWAIIGSIYGDMYEYEKACDIAEQFKEWSKENNGPESHEYADALWASADIMTVSGNYAQAIQDYRKSLDIYTNLGEHDIQTLKISLGRVMMSYGNYNGALELLQECKDEAANTYGVMSQPYAACLNNIASCYRDNKNNQKAIEILKESGDIIKKISGENSSDYIAMLGNIANNYNDMKEYSKAIEYRERAVIAVKNKCGDQHPSYAKQLSGLASPYINAGNLEKGIKYNLKALEIEKRTLGEQNEEVSSVMNDLAICYYLLKDWPNVEKYLLPSYEISRNYIIENFKLMSPKDQAMLWKKYGKNIQYRIPYFAWKGQTPALIGLAYNSMLMSKGILLNAEISQRKLLLESGDDSAIELYEQMSQNVQRLNHLLSRPIGARGSTDVDSLKQEITKQQQMLAEKSAEYGNSCNDLSISWKEVQEKLSAGEVAVEFATLGSPSDMEQDSIFAAMVLKRGMKTPEFITLCTVADLDNINQQDYYTTPMLFEKFWKPLNKHLSGVKNVYFAPAGRLHTIGIEYVMDEDSLVMSDKYNMYRLTSTREIVLTDGAKNTNKTISLYGGLIYDADADSLALHASQYTYDRVLPDEMSSGLPDSLNLRSGVNYLPGTKKEVEQISKIFATQSDFNIKQMTGYDGSEESFKNMSGHAPRVMHLATHGFYWTEKQAKRKAQRENLEFLALDADNNLLDSEDKAMLRSGIFLTGANVSLKGKRTTKETEDGILTAKELSTLDLRGLDMLVLSACQTGLGDISADGVFGLQRGFKKTGVNSMLLSLWKVDDDATQILMTEFYSNYIKGLSKLESLKMAQNTLRTNPKYSSPMYWAAFVLLDGMEH